MHDPHTPHDPYVRVRGAREHNLQGIDVDIPRDVLAVFTGVSGSGKSSLAFGTIYAEAQRRYFESVAPYARRLIHQVGAPKVGEITGLPPAVSLQQRRAAPTSRSSVGTVTNLSNSLRMLFSRAGTYPPGAGRLDSDAFSPNTAAGACPECHGLGQVHRTSEELLVPDPSLSIREGAIAAWPGAWQGKNLRDILDALGHDVDRPWRELPATAREWILFTDEQPVVTVHPVRDADRIQRPYQGTYMSARRYVMKTFSDSKSPTLRTKAERFLTSAPCAACGGSRLRPEALAVTFGGRTIAELAALPLVELAAGLDATSETARVLTADLTSRIAPVVELGLGYLSLDRPTPTLSAGELQRLRLATQLRSGLFGVVYVLDEPSAGLHPADTEALLTVLERLKAAGNSVFVVEHHLDVVRGADWLVDVGPEAGEHGGRVLHSGPVAELAAVEESATARYLFDRSPAPARAVREPGGWLKTGPVTRHNLRGVTADFPLGVFTAVTGVSGSGKSTLIGEITEDTAGVGRLVSVDQRPIGRTPRSNLATYTGLFDVVRKVFAATDGARERGFGVGRFSFNVAGGRCGLPGRGVRQRGAAVPAEHVRALPGLRRGPVQPRDAGSVVPGAGHRAGAGPDGGERGRVLRGHPGRGPQPRHLAGRGPRLSASRPARDRTVRRRGAAHQAGERAAARPARPHALPPRRADDRPPPGRRRRPDAPVARPGRRRAHRDRRRARHVRRRARGLGDRPRPGRRRRGRPDRGGRSARGGGTGGAERHGTVSGPGARPGAAVARQRSASRPATRSRGRPWVSWR
ncbi:UvrABC system protein A [Streptomyces purpurascens]